MKYTKRYAVFALLFVCSISLNVMMDMIQKLPPYRIKRNLVFPFQMLDPIEAVVLVILIIILFRKPLYACFAAIFKRMKASSGGSGGTPSSPNQSDQQQ
ncbi:hypothetical protein PaecuDRAFT_0058 [Paenibacillus curdlanolyticus YK9]|uniref:Uncharacterized protein n=1 Tax=Paenibacillus curdlanolyticus YK9 TaxID=717606 RepID=E0I4L6_9BACL|nr:hypothetical protein [Paenibacillus curdlanolyticus]EFM12547.1 hypothetical protein PaecuDRAFT_0058 [Paenibacillus curdlanolyticus YK9]